MRQYKDFTYYHYSDHHFENALNIIGWINNADGNTVIDELFLKRLIKYLDYPFNTLRSYPELREITIFGKEYTLGYSELRVLDQNGKKKYAAPDMIVYRIRRFIYSTKGIY